MELRSGGHARHRLAALLATAVALAGVAAPAHAQDSSRQTSSERTQTARSANRPPAGHSLTGRQAIAIANRSAKVRAERHRRGHLTASAFAKVPGRWQVSYFEGGRERAQVLVSDPGGRILEEWTGPQVAWRMARGYDGAFGRKLNAPYLWLPLCFVFLLPFLDPRRPFRLLHLDLLVLLAFGVSHVFFNRGEISTSVPLVYPVLAYLLVRMLVAGARSRERREPLVPLVPATWLAIGLVFLVGFRVALNVADSNVIDVGYAGVIGADRIVDGRGLYGPDFGPNNERGDTYGPATYLAYVPFEQALPWSGRWDDLPAAHAAALAFDLLTLAGLVLLGRRLRAGPEGHRLGVALAFAWAAYPYSLFALESNSNDSLVAMLLVWALVAIASPAGRGALLGLAGAAKFAPLAVAPLFATAGDEDGRGRLRSAAIFCVALGLVVAVTVLPFVPDGGLREIYDRTVGYQAGRDSPFSIWGQEPSLGWLHTVVKVGAAGLALAVAFVPRRKDAVQVAALGAAVMIALQLAATHWFYLYIPWFGPLLLVAIFAPLREPAARRPPGAAAAGERPATVAA